MKLFYLLIHKNEVKACQLVYDISIEAKQIQKYFLFKQFFFYIK